MSSGRGSQQAQRKRCSLDALSDHHAVYPSPPNSPPLSEPGDSAAQNRQSTDGMFTYRSPSSRLRRTSPSPEKNSFSQVTCCEDQPAKTKMATSTLKTLLGLDSPQCGSPTKSTGSPCKRPAPKRNRHEVDAQVESIRDFTQSSPNLEPGLRKLAKLVHCDKHDHGYPMEDRIEAWTAAFSPGTCDGKPPVVPVERQIRRVFGQLSTSCNGTTKKNERCKRRIGGQRVTNCARTIDEIILPEVYMKDTQLELFLKVLEMNMYCSMHMKTEPYKSVALWKSRIEEILKTANNIKPSNTLEETKDHLQTTDTATGRSAGPLKSTSSGSLRQSNYNCPKPDTTRKAMSYWPQAFDSTPFEIIAPRNRLADHESAYILIRDELTKRLANNDLKQGSIYLYEVDGNKGYVKLGFTTRSTRERHDEWSFECNRKPILLYPASYSVVTTIPNVRRVEALCHAELERYRLRIYCHACLKQHLEWFKVPHAQAVAVIEKWLKWMSTDPYLPNGFLKEEEAYKAHDLNRFLDEISAAAIST